MKRIAIIIATLGLLSAASPAQATSSSFVATVTGNSVSLNASASTCTYLPCTHRWVIDGVPVLSNTTRSYVTTLGFGCHSVEHSITHRTFRAPSPYRYSSTQSVCMTTVAW